MAINETASRHPRLPRAPGFLAALGVGAGLIALIASSCCLVSLGLAALGAGTSMLSGLEWLTQWRVPFLAASGVAVLGGWVSWWQGRRPSCKSGAACASPRRSVAALLLLAATFILSAAASWDMIEPMLLNVTWPR
jgi:mercuric ion transport protein